ncbi:MAG: cellulase family glycosylhydrolase, partial [Methanosarcinales archaeon]|nr:cellulase family glycosylhydrolase [Methanosarcinales archaeon]
MRETFYTEGRHLLNLSGKKVILRGINKRLVWEKSDPTGDTYFAEICKTGANSVRIVWAITEDLNPGGPPTDLEALDELITNARKNQLIPMVELHDATGDWGRLGELVDYWVQPEVVSLIQEHQAYLLVNIGDGVGDENVTPEQFISGYEEAVKRMREAGINVPLVIDATDDGKNIEILNDTAGELINADPDKNLIFSVHLYWSKFSGADADFIRSKLQAAVDRGYPLIIGGFSKYGGVAGNDEEGNPRSICSEFGEIDYETILKVCDELEIGWYAWEWGPGNAAVDPLCEAMDMTSDGRFETLKSGWATDVAESIKKASESRGYFRLQPMPKVLVSISTRVKTLKAVVDRQHKSAVSKALYEAKGDWTKALASLTDMTDRGDLPRETLEKLDLAHSIAAWSSDNVPVVKTLADDPDVTSLRDVALRYNAGKLTELASSADLKSLPKGVVGTTDEEKRKNFAVALHHELYRLETTAVLHRMVKDAEVPIADTKVRAGIEIFLDNQPDFNIRTTSVYNAIKKPEAVKDIAEEYHAGVLDNLKILQRVQAISPVPEAVPYLVTSNLISAFCVAEMPQSTFLKAHAASLGEETARKIYACAFNANIRNEQTLIAFNETMHGTGMPMIDGSQSQTERVSALQTTVDENEVPLNLESLFGDIDYCECDECLSVYSPAAYFVEILQYLRNNNIDPSKIKTDPKDITNTPLEKLFRRRPDLGCLELTCENTFTVLPYIDLVNEVMESFVVHLDEYHADINIPKQATLDVFNVRDETTVELLAQPQHINYQAYCILKNAVYPFTLPYHQPIDVARIYLKQMGTSRYELLDTFRTATETCAGVVLTADQQTQLKELHGTVLDRAVDAEFLGITQEEYIILTREAFWTKAYFDLTLQKIHTDEEYQTEIGVKPVHEYYGYSAEADMLSTVEELKAGLTFVKKQFLPRTGIQYVDLVELVKTQFINPAMPEGQALTVLESIRFSYRFLQTLVDASSSDPKVRFAKLIEFLNTAQTLVPLIDAYLHPDPCHQQDPQFCLQKADISKWVYCYFERIGKLIVLESGEGPQLPIEGHIYIDNYDNPEFVGSLQKDGTVVDQDGAIIGKVTIEGKVVDLDGKPLVEKFNVSKLLIKDENNQIIGYIYEDWLYDLTEKKLNWLPARDTCDLDKVRLTHLDGSALTVDEYDRIQRFIRLWLKLGWTIDETGQALIGSSAGLGGETNTPDECNFVRFNAFQDDCFEEDGVNDSACPEENGDIDCPDILYVPENITPGFLHQLVAIQMLIDLTGLPLDKLLTFWSKISTVGEKSLYSRLFLTHNLLGIDKIFKSDANGNYLLQSAKISEHMPVIMAALRMKADDVAAVMELRQIPDELTLANASVLYRHSLLAKILHVKISELSEVVALFGDPFKSAQDTLGLLLDWGSMEDAGFTFRQLNYLIRDHDDPLRPLAPAERTILQANKTLYDGLNAIDSDHPDVPADK